MRDQGVHEAADGMMLFCQFFARAVGETRGEARRRPGGPSFSACYISDGGKACGGPVLRV